jgi:hypothetical protein
VAAGIGNHFCTECHVGHYAASAGLSSCKQCDADKFAPSRGQSGCAACNFECLAGEYKPSCGNFRNSNTGAIESTAGTCRACASGQYKADDGNARTCEKHRDECPFPAAWQHLAPTAVNDRGCTSHPDCAENEWESIAAAKDSPRKCVPHTTCDYDNAWMSKAAGTHHDRVCTPLTTCPPGHYESVLKTLTSDRQCALCGDGTHKAEYANAKVCDLCPFGYVSRPDRISCKAVQCSHVTCKHEQHTCDFGIADHNLWPKTLTNRAYKGQYELTTHKKVTNCDGRKWMSVRTDTGGSHCTPAMRPCTMQQRALKEGPCRNGHRCGMGIITSDKSKCECAPLKPMDFKKLHRPTLVSHTMDPAASKMPLARCHGDCDTDADCELGHTCFQNHDKSPIQGCVGSPEEAMDYCVLKVAV